jgi:hypothetical protein
MSVGQSILVSGPMTRFLLLSDLSGLHVVGHPPSREEDWPVIYSYKSRRTRDHILLSHLRLLGSLFVASYDSQGYGGGILTHLHTAIH